jgi:hypothetical protein
MNYAKMNFRAVRTKNLQWGINPDFMNEGSDKQ